jgi:hypothetical protein
MDRFFVILIIALLVFNAGCGKRVTHDAGSGSAVYPDRKGYQPGPSDGINKATDLMLDYFHPLSGVVTNVENGVVRVKFENDVSVKNGMRYSVFREGGPFYHPVTNKTVGYTEDFVGRIEVTDGNPLDGLYLFTIIKGDIKAGDITRITSSKIKLAFFQDRKSDWELSELFYNSIERSGRFEILESYAPTLKPEKLSELAGELGAGAILVVSTRLKEEREFLNLRLYWAEDSMMFGEIEEPVSRETAKALASDEEFVFAASSGTEPRGSYRLAGGKLITMGDVDGNGIREIVISDGNNIRIYNLKDEIQDLWLIKGKSKEKHLYLDTLDLNNNGMSEIFVTSMVNSNNAGINSKSVKIRSFVVEYDPSKGYGKIKDNIPYLLRVAGNELFMQKSSAHKVFDGTVYQGEWKDGHYQPESPLEIPAGVNIYDFSFIDWQNNGRTHLMTFDEKGYLSLFDESGQLVWKSPKTYGKNPVSFKRETYSSAGTAEKLFVRDRLIPVKTERGQEVVVANWIPAVSRMPGLGIKELEFYSLWWDGIVMDEKLILSEVPGTITDYRVEGNRLFLVARDGLFSFFKKITSGEFSKGSTLYYYNFERNRQ